ncbi:MAG TPA: helix-turn-helix domain-containing protein [Bacillota bacterium]|jgi:excisionase family DNA binding protein|nr:helix-turn-helix domain-containing protein [Bacillota bacterium]HPG43462.1 helix-turn-helix domain-containing protein [Acholeplasmataceae bacterium]HPQ61730.1 helix-turn-helix domain-containing protein [Bacillota bacterium]HRX91283.1 helix-turn-helix domain-containing protein [Candidatus Izemoplasmatales bacterium]
MINEIKRQEPTRDYYKLEEVADILRVSRRTLSTYIKKGKLHAFKIGPGWRVSKENLVKFIDELHKTSKNK